MSAIIIGAVANWLAPLLRVDTPERYARIVYIGDAEGLTAYATDGHVLARVVVDGDFSCVGKRQMGAQWLRFLAGDNALELLRRIEPGFPKRRAMDRELSSASASSLVGGAFLGVALMTAASIIERSGLMVDVYGNEDATRPMVMHSPMTDVECDGEKWRAAISIAVMPAWRPT